MTVVRKALNPLFFLEFFLFFQKPVLTVYADVQMEKMFPCAATLWRFLPFVHPEFALSLPRQLNPFKRRSCRHLVRKVVGSSKC